MGSALGHRFGMGTLVGASRTLAAALLATGMAACASSPPSVGRADTTSAKLAARGEQAAAPAKEKGPGAAQAELALAVRSEDDDVEDQPRGFVVVASDVVKRCASVRAVQVRDDEPMAWLTILKSVATCMKEGELRGEDIVLAGPARAEMITKSIFDRLGVADGRIEVAAPANGDDCVEDCTPDRMRVEIRTASGSAVSAL